MAVDGAEALLRKRFDAAVGTIQNLPKNGSFQPSNTMKLKFYSLFKQATVGPVNTSRPGMFDLVGRAKWDAWKKLGTMTASEAMQGYVDEIISIAQTMEDSPEKQRFMEVVAEPAPSSRTTGTATTVPNGTAPAAPALVPNGTAPTAAAAVSQSASETGSGSGSQPEPAPTTSTADTDTVATAVSVVSSSEAASADHDSDGEAESCVTDDDEEFCDTLETLDPPHVVASLGDMDAVGAALEDGTACRPVPAATVAAASSADAEATPVHLSQRSSQTLVQAHQTQPPVSVDRRSVGQSSAGPSTSAEAREFADGIATPPPPATVGYIDRGRGLPAAPAATQQAARPSVTPTPAVHSCELDGDVRSLNSNVTSINARLADVEAGLQEVKQGKVIVTTVRERRQPAWWPFGGWDLSSVAAVLMWPFLANYLLAVFRRRGRRR